MPLFFAGRNKAYTTKIGHAIAYTFPSQSCSVIQFQTGYKALCVGTKSYFNSYFYQSGMLAQDLRPFKNHFVLRKDRLYLHPHMFTVKYGKLIKHKHHFWKLKYLHVKDYTVQYYFQATCSNQKKLKIVDKRCSLAITTPVIYAPLNIFTHVVTLPDVTKLEEGLPFLLLLQ